MRALVIALALVACSPPAQEPTPMVSPAPEASPAAISAELGATLAPIVAAEIGQPVSFAPTEVRVYGDWAWLVAQPQTPEGAPIDWSHTPYAERAEAGVLDGGGTTYALFRRENSAWRVIDHVIGPTDVAYMDWPQRHGAPPALMGLPTE